LKAANLVRDLLVLPDSNLEIDSNHIYTIVYIYPDSKNIIYYMILLGEQHLSSILKSESEIVCGTLYRNGFMTYVLGKDNFPDPKFADEAMDKVGKFSMNLVNLI